MDLLALAVPFFLLALVVELVVDHVRGTGFYRSNDAINSLSAGTLSTTFGYLTRIVPVSIWAYVLQGYALFDIDVSHFSFSGLGLLYWFIALVSFDFFYYWYHRCGHEISIMWAAHSVHHQSEDYNLSTALRQTSTGFLFGWIFYLPLFILGMPFEVFVTVNALDLIYQFWVHTQHVRRLGWLDRVFVTPSNHRVHHAQNEIYINRNYGGIFVLWDRLFGTFQDELDDEPVVFGVRKPLKSWNPFWANLQVYDYLLFDSINTSRWQDKVAVWFRRTGWRPADVEARYPKQKRMLASFSKFDPPVSQRFRRYVMGQFLIAVLAVLWIAGTFAVGGLEPVLIPCVLLWVTLYSLGLFNEGRPRCVHFEMLRLALLLPIGFYWLLSGVGADWPQSAVWSGLTVYCLASALILVTLDRQRNIE